MQVVEIHNAIEGFMEAIIETAVEIGRERCAVAPAVSNSNKRNRTSGSVVTSCSNLCTRTPPALITLSRNDITCALQLPRPRKRARVSLSESSSNVADGVIETSGTGVLQTMGSMEADDVDMDRQASMETSGSKAESDSNMADTPVAPSTDPSAAPAQNKSFALLAEDVAAALDTLNIQQFLEQQW